MSDVLKCLKCQKPVGEYYDETTKLCSTCYPRVMRAQDDGVFYDQGEDSDYKACGGNCAGCDCGDGL